MGQQPNQEMPPIEEIVGFLYENSPMVLQQLRSRYPEFQSLLKKGTIAGPRKDKSEDAATTKELSLRISAAEAVLQGAIGKCDSELSRMRSRLEKANRLQLISQCLTLAAGASILSTISNIWAKAEPAVKLFAGVAALVSGVMMLIVHDLQGQRSGRGPGILDRYEKLVSYQSRAEDLAQEMRIRAEGDLTGAIPIVRQINALCSQIRQLTSLILL